MGTVLVELRRYDDAIRAYSEGIETARRIGDLRMLAYGVFNTAGAYLSRNDLLRAEACLRESETLFRKLREPVMEALTLDSFGTLWEKRGKWPLAKRNYLLALEMLRKGGHELDLARTAIHASFYFNKNGEPDAALALLNEALVIGKRTRASGVVEQAQLGLAQRLEVTGGPATAKPSPDGASVS